MRTFERSTSAIRFCVFSISLPAAVACGAAPDGPSERIAEEQSPIVKGNSVSSGTATATGTVLVQRDLHDGTGVFCTGELLRNDLVITARHCTVSSGNVDTNGADYTLFMDGQTVHGSEIIDMGGTQFDYVFIVVTPFFQTGPSGNLAQGWSRPVYPGTNVSLQGATLHCYGYGSSSCSSTEHGPLLTADLYVYSADSSGLTFTNNINGQIQWEGDSGSTCYTDAGEMTFVDSFGSCDSGMASGPGPQNIKGDVDYYYSNWTPGATIYQSNSGNVAYYDSMMLDSAAGNGNPAEGVFVTPNWNPPGQGGQYYNENFGVWYDGTRWLGGVPDFSWIISITWDPRWKECLLGAVWHDQSWA